MKKFPVPTLMKFPATSHSRSVDLEFRFETIVVESTRIMATSSPFINASVQWTSQPVAFHHNHGKNIQLSQNNTVALRTRSWYYGIVCTNEPVSIGNMFKVTLMERNEKWSFGGLAMGFTGENPETTVFTQSECLTLYGDDEQLFYFYGNIVRYKDVDVRNLDFKTHDLKIGQSLGILLTKEGDLHWFVDSAWRGMVHLDDYRLNRPLWGFAGVVAQCKQVKAEICTVYEYDKDLERQLFELGLITLPKLTGPTYRDQTRSESLFNLSPSIVGHEDPLLKLLQQQESVRQQLQIKDEEIQKNILSLVQERQEELVKERSIVSLLRTENRQLQQEVTQGALENQELQRQVEDLRQTVSTLSATGNSQDSAFWQVCSEEISIREDKVLGRGAWGYVAMGTFHGTAVAIKRVYPDILEQTTLDRIRREICTMAQIRHPNLVLFIAAALNEETGPLIVTELLDITLRQAYKANRVGGNKRRIFRDVSSALVYLHQQREPIIHRDVSSANVLLMSLPNDSWLAKLSDFGSANLARYATTPGEGAILYTAPEAYPHPPTFPSPPSPQTTKIDVYSFGVLACEVITRVFPESNKFVGLIATVGHVWPEIHDLITSCVSHSPQDRPTMVNVLSQFQQLHSEP